MHEWLASLTYVVGVQQNAWNHKHCRPFQSCSLSRNFRNFSFSEQNSNGTETL